MPDEAGPLRDSTMQGVTDHFQPFYEEFTSLSEIGLYYVKGEQPRWLAEAIAQNNSRWRRFLRWIGYTPRPLWKPCVQITCPPIEEHWISDSWTEHQ